MLQVEKIDRTQRTLVEGQDNQVVAHAHIAIRRARFSVVLRVVNNCGKQREREAVSHLALS